MEISEDLRCVFSAVIAERNGSYVIEVPDREVDLDTLSEGATYRVAVLSDVGAGDGRSSDGAVADDGSGARNRSSGSDGSGSGPHRRSDGADRSTGSSSGDRADAAAGEPEPPVDRGDEVTVDIEGIGDQGDGIARVDRGYVIIVPDTEKGERVRIRVTSVKQNVAFADVIDRVERHQYE
ncbi:deoxyribonuclease [Halobacteriales archaeon QS_6_71_20]|nr:MAG: deoxyribonuclease [Halobacteriales archaeon QS_6_71_20]